MEKPTKRGNSGKTLTSTLTDFYKEHPDPKYLLHRMCCHDILSFCCGQYNYGLFLWAPWDCTTIDSSHLSGNRCLFHQFYNVKLIAIETASGESFVSTERGTIDIIICSDPKLNLPDLPITLQEVIYIPNLQANLLSVGRMTNANVELKFGKQYISLSKDGITLAHGFKVQNVFTFDATSNLQHAYMLNNIHDTTRATLWHQRMCHTNYKTLDIMSKLLWI